MRRLTFLIVDDSPVWRKIIKKFVEEKLKFRVIGEATNGIEGIELYKKLKPDFITLDIEMPNLNGISVLEMILQIDKDAKIIMISSKGEEDIIRRALLMGAKDFIIKDLEVDKWVKRFEKILSDMKKEKSVHNFIFYIINKFKKIEQKFVHY